MPAESVQLGHYWDLFSKKIVGPLLVLGKGPIKWGLSVLPSVLLSLHFLGIVSIVFSEFWQGARNPYEVVYDSSVDIEVIRTVFVFFYEKNSKHLKHKPKHLSNFHQNNKPKKQIKASQVTFHLDNMLKKLSSR